MSGFHVGERGDWALPADFGCSEAMMTFLGSRGHMPRRCHRSYVEALREMMFQHSHLPGEPRSAELASPGILGSPPHSPPDVANASFVSIPWSNGSMYAPAGVARSLSFGEGTTHLGLLERLATARAAALEANAIANEFQVR